MSFAQSSLLFFAPAADFGNDKMIGACRPEDQFILQ
jgi:hypothetical protein